MEQMPLGGRQPHFADHLNRLGNGVSSACPHRSSRALSLVA